MAVHISSLTDELLAEAFGAGVLDRGREYQRQGRVHVLEVRPDRLKGVTRGSGNRTYLTQVGWQNSTWGGLLFDDQCTCPLTGGCKHVVALVLTARPDDPAPGRWRQLFAHLPAEAPADAVAAAPPAAMALQFTLEHSTARYEPPGRYLSVRPLRMGKQGRFIKTGASWQQVNAGSCLDLAPEHAHALSVLLTGLRRNAYYSMPATLRLDQFGERLWQHLDRAAAAGVELIDRHGRAVGLDPAPVQVTADLSQDAEGRITVSAGLSGEAGVVSDDGAVGFLGRPAHGMWLADQAARIQLVRFAAPVAPAVFDLLEAGPVEVPDADVAEFLDVFVPRLARVAAVGSQDGTVSMEAPQPPRLQLTIARDSASTAVLTWSLAYRRRGRTDAVPLAFRPGVGRNAMAETRVVTDAKLPLHLLPQLGDGTGWPHDTVLSGQAVVTLLTEVVPWLQERGEIDIVLAGRGPDLREATEDPLITVSVADADDSTDWFDLSVQVSVDGEQIDFTELFTALNHDEDVLLLASGTWLRLDRPEFTRLRELIAEAHGLAEHDGPGSARINRFQASWWDELATLGVVQQQSARWAQSMGALRQFTAPAAVPVPTGLDATLRTYQQEGLDWLAFLHEHRLGGILADDMGLGKTVQTLAFACHVLSTNPDARFLVVAPTSVVPNWEREAARFAPRMETRTVQQTQSRRGSDLAAHVGDARLVVTSYALFRLEFEQYQQLGWEVLVLDEAQIVKNHQGKTYQCARRLDAAMKLAVTGTPMENSLMDLWSLLSITAPGLYPDPKRFGEVYRQPIESGRDPKMLATLQARVAPLMRRRTKAEVLTELPPKTEQVLEVELSPKHARIYQRQLQRQRQKVLSLVDDMQKNRFEILKSLTLLRQLSLDPGLVDEADSLVGSAKLDQLVEHLKEITAEGHRALVFSQFTRFLGKARDRLDEAGLAYSYLDGRTRRRDEAITRFKDGGVPVFLISLKAGGFGLNLTEADYCFVLDPWWNPATEAQAVDRAHRIGQRGSVMVYRYVSRGTIEEKVMQLKARKQALFDSVMDGDGKLSGAVTADDIRGLLDAP